MVKLIIDVSSGVMIHFNGKALFGRMPALIWNVAALVYRKLMIGKQVYVHGLSMHTMDEIFHLGKVVLDALSAFLSDKPLFYGR